ncbi:MAG: protein kinase domain-containing protein [Nannocystaceae bacterium]|nr:protein kinase [bacterium]
MDACPDEADLAEFVRGELRAEDAEGVEAHLDRCEACAQVVIELVRIFDDSLGASDQGLPTLEGARTERSVDGEEEEDDYDALPSGAEVGRYRVLECIGFGGMGVVYSAYDPQLDRRVALKVLRGGPGAEEARRNGRLLREAKVMAKLSHPNVIVVHDVGSFDGRVFLAMEFVEGTTLSRWMRGAKRSWRELRDTFLAAGRGLAAAHAAGLVHRDFKPDNVLIGDDGRVRVTDFGLARNRDESIEQSIQESLVPVTPAVAARVTGRYATLTKTGALVGTPAYMAPEQYSGRGVTGATDQFAFCVAFYEALYGERPFPGRTLAELATNVCLGKRRPLGEARVPSRVRDAILRGLSVDPDERFDSMEELLAIINRRPTRTLRRWAMVGVPTVVAAVSLWWDARPAEAGPTLCRDEGSIDGVWNDASQGRLRAALGDGGGQDQVADALDDYADRWSDARQSVCGAVDGDTLDVAQGHCLARARSRLDALLGVITRGETRQAEAALRAISALPDPEPCTSDTLVAANLVPLPALHLEAKVTEARAELDRIRALSHAGTVSEASEALGEAAKKYRDLDDGPFQAELRYLQGYVAFSAGRYKAAKAALEDAAMMGVSSHHRLVAAEAWARLVFMETNVFRDYDAAHRAARMARAELQALGNPSRTMSVLRAHEAGLAVAQERYDDALETYAALLDLPENDAPIRRADLLINLVHVHVAQGSWDEAREAAKEYVDIYLETFGPKHANLVMGYYNLGFVAYASGDFRAALDPLQKSIALAREVLPANHPELGSSLSALCRTEDELGHHEEAVVACAEARDILRASGQLDAEQLAEVSLALAEVTTKAGDLEGADALLTEVASSVAAMPESSPSLSARLWAARGRHANARGDLAGAQSLFQRAIDAWGRSESGRDSHDCRARLALAEVVSARGDASYASELIDDVRTAEHCNARSLEREARALKKRLDGE